MSSIKVDEHLSAGKRVVEGLGMVASDKSVLLSMEKANLASVAFGNIGGNIHFRYLKTRKRTDFASDASEDAGKETVEDATTGFRQELRAGFLAQRGQMRIGRVSYRYLALRTP